ncbi:hypothetical protein LT493_44720 [Streptomyces tricolor]|nr:hypothetical protein [Streptomyces tricolor]
MSGIAYNTGDVGSIYRHDARMYARDLQWKAFLPAIMTMDGWATDLTTGKPADQQPWRTASRHLDQPEVPPAGRAAAAYMHTLSAQAARTGVGAVRPLWLEYPDDPGTLGAQAKYEFLSGPDFLVAPVYEDADTRDGIYLPKGTWTDYWTGRTYQGPTTVNGYHAPLDTLPLFVREGAIVPMWPEGTTSWQTRDRHELDWDLYPARAAPAITRCTRTTASPVTSTKGRRPPAGVDARRRPGHDRTVGASRGDYAGKRGRPDVPVHRARRHGTRAGPARRASTATQRLVVRRRHPGHHGPHPSLLAGPRVHAAAGRPGAEPTGTAAGS